MKLHNFIKEKVDKLHDDAKEFVKEVGQNCLNIILDVRNPKV